MVLTIVLTVSTVLAVTVSVTLRFYKKRKIAERRRSKTAAGKPAASPP